MPLTSYNNNRKGVTKKKDLHSIKHSHDNQPKRAVRIIRRPRQQSNSLADRGSSTERHDQQPRTGTSLTVRDLGDTGTETETLEHLMKQDSDQQNGEALDGDANRHADEDRVEQDTALEKGNVQGHLLVDQGVDGLAGLDVAIGRVREGSGDQGLAVFSRTGIGLLAEVSLLPVGSGLDHVDQLQTLAAILFIENDEPGRHFGPGTKLFVMIIVIGIISKGVPRRGLRVCLAANFFCVQFLGHHFLVVDILGGRLVEGIFCVGPAVLWPTRTVTVSLGSGMGMAAMAVVVESSGTSVGMASGLAVEPHLDDEQDEHGAHHDDAWHGRVLSGEQIRKAWVHQVTKGRWE